MGMKKTKFSHNFFPLFSSFSHSPLTEPFGTVIVGCEAHCQSISSRYVSDGTFLFTRPDFYLSRRVDNRGQIT